MPVELAGNGVAAGAAIGAVAKVVKTVSQVAII